MNGLPSIGSGAFPPARSPASLSQPQSPPSVRPRLRAARIAASIALVLVWWPIGVAVASGDDTLCGPFDAAATNRVAQEATEVRLAQLDRSAPNRADRRAASPAPAASAGPDEILRLPAPGTESDTTAAADAVDAPPSEAILALPKNEAGQIPSDFELGPGTEIRQSFFSPVICATVARVAGPPGATLEQLVTVVPDGSALVPNDVYASASSEVRRIGEAVATEPDPYASLQYSLAVTGVRDARHLSTGAGVTIALLDSAPEIGHQDLSPDHIRAIEQDEAMPVGVHGTLMAGVINAIEENGFGIAGIAPGANLVSIPICRPSGSAGGQCTIFDLLRGLDQAWNAEATIVNLSLSGPPNILLERGVARLEELGAVVVAAAGNEGIREKRYPAAYPTVIGVGAVDREGSTFAASNRGPWVELGAPGVDVLSTIPGNAFAFANGTSLAAAHVTGALAVLSSVTIDPKIARGEMFRAAHARGASGMPALPKVCDVFARLGIDCAAPPGEAAPSAALGSGEATER